MNNRKFFEYQKRGDTSTAEKCCGKKIRMPQPGSVCVRSKRASFQADRYWKWLRQFWRIRRCRLRRNALTPVRLDGGRITSGKRCKRQRCRPGWLRWRRKSIATQTWRFALMNMYYVRHIGRRKRIFPQDVGMKDRLRERNLERVEKLTGWVCLGRIIKVIA